MIQGRLDEAEQYYNSAIQNKVNVGHSYYSLGYIFQKRDKLEEAINYYSLAIRNDVNIGHSYYNIGYIFQIKNRLEKAEKYYNLAIQNRACVGHAYYSLGGIYKTLGTEDPFFQDDNLLQRSVDNYRLATEYAQQNSLNDLQEAARRELREVIDRLDSIL